MRAIQSGGQSNPAPAPPAQPVVASYQCVGSAYKKFDNWNGAVVGNGGTPYTFSTAGQAFCLVQLTTYHWNGGNGAAPGSISLKSGSTTIGTWKAVGVPGQNNVANAGWVANVPTQSPVILKGMYTCADSDPATWSQNADSAHQGFCRVWVMDAKHVATPS